jgi:hypothetical protein
MCQLPESMITEGRISIMIGNWIGTFAAGSVSIAMVKAIFGQYLKAPREDRTPTVTPTPQNQGPVPAIPPMPETPPATALNITGPYGLGVSKETQPPPANILTAVVSAGQTSVWMAPRDPAMAELMLAGVERMQARQYAAEAAARRDRIAAEAAARQDEIAAEARRDELARRSTARPLDPRLRTLDSRLFTPEPQQLASGGDEPPEGGTAPSVPDSDLPVFARDQVAAFQDQLGQLSVEDVF